MSNINQELKNIIEAAIFIADEPITIDQLLSMFDENVKPDKKSIRLVLDQLKEDYDQRGIELVQIAKGYRFQSREDYRSWLQKLFQLKPPKYSKAALETLAIIAYRQPVTRGDIEEIRGVSVSTDIMRSLLNRQWVHVVGVKDVPGRPALYATTKEFLAYFNVSSIKDLPELDEKRDLLQVARENQIELALENVQDDDESESPNDEQTPDKEKQQPLNKQSATSNNNLVSNSTLSV